MIKRVTLLRRREDLTEQAFRAHWAEPHAAIARGFEGLLRYNQNRIDAVCWQTGPVRFEVGGIVKLWFKSPDAVERNAVSGTMEALIEDEPRFLSGLTALAAGESWISQSASCGIKYMILAQAADPERLLAAVERARPEGGADCASPCVYLDRLAPSFTREALWSEPQPPDAAITVWCDDADVAGAFVDGPASRLEQVLAREAGSAAAYRIDELRIV